MYIFIYICIYVIISCMNINSYLSMNKNMNIRTHVHAHITNACTCLYMCVSVYMLVCACGFVRANNTVWPWCSTETHEKLHPHTLPPAHAPWPKHIKIKTQKDVHKHNQTQSSCPTNTPCPQYEAAAALCRYISRVHDTCSQTSAQERAYVLPPSSLPSTHTQTLASRPRTRRALMYSAVCDMDQSLHLFHHSLHLFRHSLFHHSLHLFHQPLPLFLSAYVSAYLSVGLPACHSVCRPVCLSACLSIERKKASNVQGWRAGMRASSICSEKHAC